MTNKEYSIDRRPNDEISRILGTHAIEAETSYRMLKEQLTALNAEIGEGHAARLGSHEIEQVSQALEEARQRYKAAIKRLGDFAMYNKIPSDLLPPQ